MKVIAKTSSRAAFKVIAESRSAQAALMTLAPGASSDDEMGSDDLRNEHPRSEQWLYVIDGTARVTVKQAGRRRTVRAQAGALLLIEKGELHQVTNAGEGPLRTLNFYVPPAYSGDGEVRPCAKRN